MIEGSIMHWPLPWPGKRMPSIIISDRVRVAGVETAQVDLGAALDIGARHRRNRTRGHVGGREGAEQIGGGERAGHGEIIGLKFVTGTPTAAVPRISEPVISTVSGISSAWATIRPEQRRDSHSPWSTRTQSPSKRQGASHGVT